MSVVSKSFQWGDHKITLETGRIARQATGAVMAHMGDTTVLCTVVEGVKAARAAPFFPLTVNYREDLRRGQDPRWLLPPRGSPDREGDAHQPSHRPADSPVVPRRVS